MKHFIQVTCAALAVICLSSNASAQQCGYLTLDGSSEATTIDTGPDLADKSFTVEFWVKRDRTGVFEWVLGQGQAQNNHGLTIGFYPNGNFVFSFWNNNLDYFETYLNRADTWNHYACVYDFDATTGRGTRHVYHNGDPTPAKTETDIFPYSGTGPLRFGHRPQGGGAALFEGGVDELRIWNRALSGEEIHARFGRALDDTERADPDLLAYYPFDRVTDQNTGMAGENDLEDASTNNHHADVFVGAAITTRLPDSFDPEVTPTATYVVTNTNATGAGSLGELLQTARELALRRRILVPEATSTFKIDCTGVSGTVTLSSVYPVEGYHIIIDGPGENDFTIDGGGTVRLFQVSAGGSLHLRDLTLQNGLAQGAASTDSGGSPGLGGAVFVDAHSTLSAERVTFAENVAKGGNGLQVSTATPTTQSTGDLPGETGRGGYGEFPANNLTTEMHGDGEPSEDDSSGAPKGSSPGADGQSAPTAGPGSNGTGFLPGGRGMRGGGGGSGAFGSHSGGGAGGKGGDGGTGGIGGYGAGGGAGGSGGGGGGAGGGGSNNTNPGAGGAGGTGGTGAPGGFGAGHGEDGNSGEDGRAPVGGPPSGGVSGNGTFNGSGAGMGGAIFIAARATVSLDSVFFYNNRASGGAGRNAASDGHGIGGAAHLMPGAKLTSSRAVEFFANVATKADDVTEDDFIPNSNSFYGDSSIARLVAEGNFGGVSRPLYYYPANNTGADPSDAIFRYRWNLYSHNGGDPKFEYAIDPLSLTPDPTTLFTQTDRNDAIAARDALEQHLDNSDLEIGNLLLDICYDMATFDGFLAGFDASYIERDARSNIDPATPYTLDAHIDAYADPETGILKGYQDAVGCYGRILTDPQLHAIFIDFLPIRNSRPLETILPSGVLAPIAPPEGGGYGDLTLLFELLTQYGDAAHRLAELYLKRDATGDRDLGLATAEAAARYLNSASLTLIPLVPEGGTPRDLSNAIANWEATSSRLTDIQSHLLSGINTLGFPDDFLLLVGGTSGDSFDTLKTPVEDYVNAAVSELDTAIGDFDSYGANRDEYRDRLFALIIEIDDRIAEIGDEDTGLIQEQIIKIDNAQLKIQTNRIEIDNINEAINIEFQRNEALKENNVTRANIRVEYLDKHRTLDQEIATIETAQKGADFLAGLADPSDPLTKLQKFARVSNFLFQAGAEVAKADLEKRKHELAGAEIRDITHVDNLDLDANFTAFMKTKLLDLKRLSVESDIAANVLRREMNKAADLIAELNRLQSRYDAISAPGNSLADEAVASRYYANPIHQLRLEDSTTRADATFKKAQLWMFILMRSLEYKWNQPFVQEDNGQTFTAAQITSARNARDLDDIRRAMEQFDTNRNIDFPPENFQTRSTRFSVRQDLFGFKDGEQHRDPISGELVDAITAFRSKLVQLRDGSKNGRVVSIPFHTLRTLPLNSFFRGVVHEFNPGTGQYEVSDFGVALDKINWVKLHIHGDFGGNFSELGNNTISYGGTTFVRRVRLGRIEDPSRPDRVVDELVPYDVRSYLLSDGVFPPEQYADSLFDGSVTALVTDTGTPAASAAGVADGFETNNFADRSVAATDWEVRLSVIDNGVSPPAVFPIEQANDIEIIINHRSTDRIAN